MFQLYSKLNAIKAVLKRVNKEKFGNVLGTLDVEHLTEDEMSMIGLKSRSGYVKGLGIRPSSSLRTSTSSSLT